MTRITPWQRGHCTGARSLDGIGSGSLHHQHELNQLEQSFTVAMQEAEISYTPEPFWQHMHQQEP